MAKSSKAGSDSKSMKAELERLRAENEQLKEKANKAITFKVGNKGGVSVYGLGRFPITLYKEQWDQLFEVIDGLKDFIVKALKEGKLKLRQG